MKFTVIGLSAALALAAASGSAQAALLWDQPLDTWNGGWCSPCSGDLPAPNYDYRSWGSFTLSGASTLTGGRFAVHDIGPASNDLNISIWDTPGGTILYQLDLTGADYATEPVGANTYWAVIDLPGWALGAGNFHVSMFGTNGNHLGWGNGSQAGDDSQRDGNGANNGDNHYVGFALFGDQGVVPEPVSLALFGAGLAALGLTRRR